MCLAKDTHPRMGKKVSLVTAMSRAEDRWSIFSARFLMTICQLDHGETVLYSFDIIWFDKMTLKFLHLKSFTCYMEGITSFNQVEEYITFFRFQNAAYTFFWHIVFNNIRIMYYIYYIKFEKKSWLLLCLTTPQHKSNHEFSATWPMF